MDCFLFDIGLSSKNLEEAAMEFCDNLIGMVKTNTKLFWEETIENLTKDWPGGSNLVLRSKPMVPGSMPIIAIG